MKKGKKRFGIEEVTPAEQKQEISQASCGHVSKEAKLSVENLESSDRLSTSSDSGDSSQDIDAILKAALEDYEAQLTKTTRPS